MSNRDQGKSYWRSIAAAAAIVCFWLCSLVEFGSGRQGRALDGGTERSARAEAPERDSRAHAPSTPLSNSEGQRPDSQNSENYTAMSQWIDGGTELVAEVRNRWSGERIDPKWTADERRYVTGMMEDFNIDGEIRQVSCGSTVCRINLAFSDARQAEQLAGVAGDRPTERWMELVPIAGGVTVDVFVSKGRMVR